jgi:dTDP-4-dehydrorhamnose reductase
VEVTPIATADFPTAAHRPRNSVLDCRGSVAQLGFAPASWRANLRDALANMTPL